MRIAGATPPKVAQRAGAEEEEEEEEEEEKLPEKPAREYRALAARANYLAADRMDI